jgi:type IV secretion system protein VirD4
MVSRQETARPLLTPGEVMQLPPADELVLVSGLFPIRAKKARYYEDRQLQARILPPPKRGAGGGAIKRPPDDWSQQALATEPANTSAPATEDSDDSDAANAGIRREPELPAHEAVDPPPPREAEPEPDTAEGDDEDTVRARTLVSRVRATARQASMDPDDGIAL